MDYKTSLYLDYKLFEGTEEEFLAIKSFIAKQWELNGKLHREDGPAAIYSDGAEYWYQNGERHREDGPARVWSDGSREWYFKNTELTNVFPIGVLFDEKEEKNKSFDIS